MSSESDNDTKKEKKSKATVILMCLVSLWGSVVFSFVMSSLWPYMKKLDPTVTETLLGWIQSVFSIAQLLSSLIFGYWMDRRKSLEPLVASLLVLIVSSGMYAYAGVFGKTGVWILFAARAMMGVFFGSVTISRAVMANISTPRTLGLNMSYIGMSQSVGFFLGPGIQTLSIFAGEGGLYIPSIRLRLDYYTFPGYLFIVMGIVTIALLCVYFDDGGNDSKNDSGIQENAGTDSAPSSSSPDLVAISICLFLFLFSVATLAISETIVAPIIMAEHAFSQKKTVYVGGSMLAGCGIVALINILSSVRLTKKFTEKKVILLGFIIIFIGQLFFLPWGPGKPKVTMANIRPINGTIKVHNSTTAHEITGCPYHYKWCLTDPKLALPQLAVGLLVIYAGFSMSYVVMMALYAKVVGPTSQGKFMGWLAFAGGIARILGPLYVTFLFKHYGLRWMTIGLNGLILCAIVLFVITWKRVVPFGDRNKQLSGNVEVHDQQL